MINIDTAFMRVIATLSRECQILYEFEKLNLHPNMLTSNLKRRFESRKDILLSDDARHLPVVFSSVKVKQWLE
jgi:hypothetical protein